MDPNLQLKLSTSITKLNPRSVEEIEALFAEVRAQFDRECAEKNDLASIENLRLRWRGRKGLDRSIRGNWLKSEFPLRFAVGKAYNELKSHIESALVERDRQLTLLLGQETAPGGEVDLTLPGLAVRRGARHLITQTIEEMCAIFARIGFSAVEGPEVETDYYNFEALNIPADHPARDDFDTLYLELTAAALPAELRGPSDPRQRLLLRTHTSPLQIRIMEKQPPPVRVVVPGKVFRHDNPDASHSFMFHQLEGLAVDRDITFRDLKGVFDYFLREFFGPETRTRFSPSYFPFTEPSADVAASCSFCKGRGCRTCKQTGWIELLGSGMVDPAVFRYVGYNPAEVSGFAFGMGVERFAMLKYGLDDLQVFFQNDIRFLEQFAR